MPLVIWDDGCSFCATSVRIIRALDWLGRFSYAGSSNPKVLERWGISREEADRELKLVLHDRVVGGFDAVVEIAAQLPLTTWFAPLLRPAAVRRIGRRVYAAIAARRKCSTRIWPRASSDHRKQLVYEDSRFHRRPVARGQMEHSARP